MKSSRTLETLQLPFGLAGTIENLPRMPTRYVLVRFVYCNEGGDQGWYTLELWNIRPPDGDTPTFFINDLILVNDLANDIRQARRLTELLMQKHVFKAVILEATHPADL